MTKAFIGLSSNEAAEIMLPAAVDAIRRARLGEIVALSRTYESNAAAPGAGQYLNAAISLETAIEPPVLTSRLREIEMALGRRRGSPAVAIDLDLCLYGGLVDPGMRVPRNELMTHAHAIVPVAECDPEFVHPETGRTLASLAAQVTAGDPRPLSVREDIALGSMEGEGTR